MAAPLAQALRRLVLGESSAAADAIAAVEPQVWRVGGSDAQREVVEETRICALVRAGRHAEALEVIDRRLDRRHCRRDTWFQAQAQLTEIWSPSSGDVLRGQRRLSRTGLPRHGQRISSARRPQPTEIWSPSTETVFEASAF